MQMLLTRFHFQPCPTSSRQQTLYVDEINCAGRLTYSLKCRQFVGERRRRLFSLRAKERLVYVLYSLNRTNPACSASD